MSNARFLSLIALFLVHSGQSSECNGNAKPGPPNLKPIVTESPKLVSSYESTNSSAKAKLYVAGNSEDSINIVHLWGDNPYDWGYAHGKIAKPQLLKFFPAVYAYLEEQVFAKAKNNSFFAHVAKIGLSVALDLSYDVTKKYVGNYVMEEIQGMADATGVSADDIRRVMWIGELTRGSCSMFGAWGNATRTRGGDLLQLRALDWDTEGPFKDFHQITVYHPKNTTRDGHSWANLGFSGWTASITGMSSVSLGVSEIGVSFPDSSFGPESYLASGYPFGFIIRDVLQYDQSLDDAINRITNAKRTCDLLLGVGDGNSNEFRGFQYSPNFANVFDDKNLQPVEEWHPRIQDVVYWGMDWICPNDNRMLSDQLNAFHGNITAYNTIHHILPYVQTGNLHIAIYDYSHMEMYVATARSQNETGEINAYLRTFIKLDMNEIFNMTP